MRDTPNTKVTSINLNTLSCYGEPESIDDSSNISNNHNKQQKQKAAFIPVTKLPSLGELKQKAQLKAEVNGDKKAWMLYIWDDLDINNDN